MPRAALLLLLFVPASFAAAQTATTRLLGRWEYDGDESLQIHWSVPEHGKASMWINQDDPFSDDSVTCVGTWHVISEGRDDLGRLKLEIELVWSNNPTVRHKVLIFYDGENRFEQAFNDEPRRFYNRVHDEKRSAKK